MRDGADARRVGIFDDSVFRKSEICARVNLMTGSFGASFNTSWPQKQVNGPARYFFRRIGLQGFDKSCFSVRNCNILQFFAAF